MNETVRVLSDLHLGHKGSRISQVSTLRPLIAGAGKVIFNGDTWQELARPFFQRASEMLEELKSLCHEEGAEAVFLSGNHDPGWPGPGWVELAGGRIIITHGDALLFDGSPWKREILVHGARVLEMWDEHPEADKNIEERLFLARKMARELHSTSHPNGCNFLQRAWDAEASDENAGVVVDSRLCGWGILRTLFSESGDARHRPFSPPRVLAQKWSANHQYRFIHGSGPRRLARMERWLVQPWGD
jgi:hypothetical protein